MYHVTATTPEPAEDTFVGREELMSKLFPDPNARPSKSWLHRRCKDGTIPYIKLGHLVRFCVADVIAALRQRSKDKQRMRRKGVLVS